MFSVSPPSFWVRFGNRHSLHSLTHLSIVFQGNLLHRWSGESSYPASHFSTGRWICTTLPGTEKFCNVKKMWQRRIFRSSWLLQVWYLRAYLLHRFFLARFFHDEFTWKLCARSDSPILSLYASLIKMVYAIAAKSQQRPRWHQLQHAIKRNFGGLIEGDPVEIFKRYYTEKDVSWPMEQYLAGVELVSTLRSLHFTELYPIINHCKMVH